MNKKIQVAEKSWFGNKFFSSENIRRLSYFTTEHQKNMYFVQNYSPIAEKRPCRKRLLFLDTVDNDDKI